MISVAAWLWHWHDAYNLLILMYSRFLETYIIRQTDVCKLLNIKLTAMTGRTVVISQDDRAHVSRWTQKACICPARGVSSVQHLVDGQELCMYGNDLHMERPNSSHYWNSLNQRIQDVFTVMAFILQLQADLESWVHAENTITRKTLLGTNYLEN